MYVFMKLQHHGRALLAFSGEWEGAGGREDEQQTVSPKSHFPGLSWSWGWWGAQGRGLQCPVLCSSTALTFPVGSARGHLGAS